MFVSSGNLIPQRGVGKKLYFLGELRYSIGVLMKWAKGVWGIESSLSLELNWILYWVWYWSMWFGIRSGKG